MRWFRMRPRHLLPRPVMHLRATLLALVALPALAACGGRPPPPPPPPAPVAVPVDSLELARQARAEAQRWFDAGTRLGRQGRWAEAEASYRRAVVAYGADPTYHFALSAALLNQTRLNDAADAFREGIDVEEASPTPNHRLLAEDYERLIQILLRAGRTDLVDAARDRQRYHRDLRDVTMPR
ncbi:MAG: Tetratricopeptide repeat-containing protein [Gemmatimonadetes bacterium]|nr:Tetratricopeptide repeat-containing protein [Gemmatimonadota bacterium]